MITAPHDQSNTTQNRLDTVRHDACREGGEGQERRYAPNMRVSRMHATSTRDPEAPIGARTV